MIKLVYLEKSFLLYKPRIIFRINRDLKEIKRDDTRMIHPRGYFSNTGRRKRGRGL